MGQPVSQLTIGNTQLVDYGIQGEQSDYRAHVGYKTQHLFVFPTSEAKQTLADGLRTGRYRTIPVRSKVTGNYEVCTALGVPVPLDDISSLQSILIPPDIYQRFRIVQGESTTLSGEKAVYIVMLMLKRRLITLPIEVVEITEKSLQIQGQDIVVKANLRIQIKCDYRAGYRPEGSGNVFLQTAECNPLKRH